MTKTNLIAVSCNLIEEESVEVRGERFGGSVLVADEELQGCELVVVEGAVIAVWRAVVSH